MGDGESGCAFSGIPKKLGDKIEPMVSVQVVPTLDDDKTKWENS
mgnify:CR=1 FL=1